MVITCLPKARDGHHMSPKIEKKYQYECYARHFGHFSEFPPDDHLYTCFSDQQDFPESIFGLQILRNSKIKAQYSEKKRK